jgi:hypothetical protein
MESRPCKFSADFGQISETQPCGAGMHKLFVFAFFPARHQCSFLMSVEYGLGLTSAALSFCSQNDIIRP